VFFMNVKNVAALLVLLLLIFSPSEVESADRGQPLTAKQGLAKVTTEGTSLPEWLEETPLDYPKTLNLKWGKAMGWNPNKDPGAYFHGKMATDPKNFKKAVKLLYQILPV